MLEKEIAIKLFQPTIKLDKHNTQTLIPKDLFNEISKCNFDLLKQECKKLGFNICKTNETPFDKRYYKSQYKKGVLYVTYTDTSINNINFD